MGDVASSVLARLKNKAKESGRSYQLCLQMFCQEEFLRRLEKSKYVDNLVLKGGLFIYSLTEFDSRVTVDVDFLLKRIPNTPEQLKRVVKEIISVETGNDFVTFEIKDVAPIAVAKKYAGIGVTLSGKIKNTRTPFSIDFGVGDVIVPKQEKRRIPTQLDDFKAPVLRWTRFNQKFILSISTGQQYRHPILLPIFLFSGNQFFSFHIIIIEDEIHISPFYNIIPILFFI